MMSSPIIKTALRLDPNSILAPFTLGLASALLEKAGVATIGEPDFSVHGEGYIRLSYANCAENIRRALVRMGEFLSASPGTEA